MNGYSTVSEFAKTFLNKNGEPVNPKYIYELRGKEKKKPGSTILEFKDVSGIVFVRRRKTNTKKGSKVKAHA